MSTPEILASLVAVHLAANVSPGPNIVFVTQAAAAGARPAGFTAALGLTVGATLWAAAAAAGLGLLAHLDWLQLVLRTLGGLYLSYLGVRLWVGGEAAPSAPSPGPSGGWSMFRRGVATNLANPASLVFFGGIFAALLPPALPLWVRIAAVAVIATDALLWYAGLALVFSTPPVRLAYRRAGRWIDRVMGGFLALLGLKLILSGR
jgi:threonine/homoserine/homoserine lactone efflux protein